MVCSLWPDVPTARRVLDTGVEGFLSEQCAELCHVVKAVSDGATVYTRAVSALVREALRLGGSPRLAERERSVADRLARGRTVAQIAQDLHLSPHTVNTYAGRARRKLGASNREDMLRCAWERGEIATPPPNGRPWRSS